MCVHDPSFNSETSTRHYKTLHPQVSQTTIVPLKLGLNRLKQPAFYLQTTLNHVRQQWESFTTHTHTHINRQTFFTSIIINFFGCNLYITRPCLNQPLPKMSKQADGIQCISMKPGSKYFAEPLAYLFAEGEELMLARRALVVCANKAGMMPSCFVKNQNQSECNVLIMMIVL